MSSSPPPQAENPLTIEDEKITVGQKLKSALWLHLAHLTDRTTISLSKNSTPQFIGALTELVWAQLAEASRDSEEFAREAWKSSSEEEMEMVNADRTRHAGRTTITTADIMLLARRNDALKGVLEECVAGVRDGRGV